MRNATTSLSSLIILHSRWGSLGIHSLIILHACSCVTVVEIINFDSNWVAKLYLKNGLLLKKFFGVIKRNSLTLGIRLPTNHLFCTSQKWKLCVLGMTFFVIHYNGGNATTLVSPWWRSLPYEGIYASTLFYPACVVWYLKLYLVLC